MAFTIPFKNKYVYFPDSCLHTQGEARAETYDLTGPRYYDGRDLSQLSWYARATHPDYRTIISRQLTASVDPEDDALLIVTWPMEADFLAYPGQLMVEFVAKTADGEEIIKLQSNGLKIAASVAGKAAPTQNTFEDALNKMEKLAEDTINAAAQSKVDAERAEKAQSTAVASAAAALASEQSSATSKQAAESAAKEAKEAAQEAVGFRTMQGGAVLPADGDTDLTQPYPTKIGASVTVTSAANRIDSVTINGFTTQDGSGDASSANVREIENAGMFTNTVVIDGTVGFYIRIVENGFVVADVSRFTDVTMGSKVVSSYLKAFSLADETTKEGIRAFSSSSGFAISIKQSKLTGTDESAVKAYFSARPLTVGYQSTEDTGKFYSIVEVEQGDNYHCTIVELKDRLHSGDKLDTNIRGEYDAYVEFDGSADENWQINSGSTAGADGSKRMSITFDGPNIENTSESAIPVAASNQLKVASAEDTYTAKVENSFDVLYSDSSNLLHVRLEGISTTEALKTRLRYHPLRVFLKSASGGMTKNIKREEHIKRTKILTSQMNWSSSLTSQSGKYRYSLDPVLSDALTPETEYIAANMVCSAYKTLPHFSTYSAEQGISIATNGRLVIFDTQFESGDLEGFKANLDALNASGSPVVIEYELDQPEVYADTPIIVNNPQGIYTVSGENGTTCQALMKRLQDGGDATTLNGHSWDDIIALINEMKS